MLIFPEKEIIILSVSWLELERYKILLPVQEGGKN